MPHNGRRYVLFACPTIGGMARFLPSRYTTKLTGLYKSIFFIHRIIGATQKA